MSFIPERHIASDPVVRESSVLAQLKLNDTGNVETVTIQSLDGVIEVASATIGNDSLVLTSAMQAALTTKQDVLVSGTSIKTVNSTSLLGSGNITIDSGGGSWGDITGTLADQTDLQAALDAKANGVDRDLTYAPNLGKTYSQLLGTPPSILDAAHLSYITALKNQRDANCPLAKTTNYYFSNAGSDSNPGTLASPWQTVARCNAICSPLGGQRVEGRRLTVADSTGFKLNGRSFWVGCWVRNTASNYYGNVFEMENSYSMLIGYSGNGRVMFQHWTTSGQTLFTSTLTAGLGTDTYTFVQWWYDHTTRVLSVSTNNGAAETVTLPAQLNNSSNPVMMGNGPSGISFAGDMGRTFFLRDYVPTADDRAAMYNSGKGLRSYLIPAALKATFVANSGSYWDMNGTTGTTTYADYFSGQTLTRSVAQNSVAIPGPDADSAVTSSNGVISGGADIACLFKRGDKFSDAGLVSTNHRGNLTIADYGTGSLPVLSLFTVNIGNSWTLVSGTRYKRSCSAVGWVKKIGDDYLPFSLVLAKASSAANCGSTSNSFFYDTGAGELHLNVGADPATVSITGWEGTARTPTLSHAIGGNFQRLENLILLGSGITEPGNASGYGLLVGGATAEEHVLKNVHSFYTGYHAIGHISTKAIATWIECKAGLSANRNESGTTGSAANGTIYVSYCGSGDQECILWDSEVTHGVLPSYDWTGNDGMGGILAHTAGAYHPALMLSYRTTYATTDYPCGYGTNFGTAESATWAGQRAWAIEERIRTPYRCGFSIPYRFDAGGGSWSSVVVSGYDADLPALGSIGYLLGSRGYWLLNSTFEIDCTGYTGTFNLLGNIASNTTYVAAHCRFAVTNTSGAGVVRVGDSAAVGTITGPWTNTIISCEGTVTATRGAAPTTVFVNCAFRGMTGIGTNPVDLANVPALTHSNNSWQLYGAGATGLSEYDAGGTLRRTTPTIGPWENR